MLGSARRPILIQPLPSLPPSTHPFSTCVHPFHSSSRPRNQHGRKDQKYRREWWSPKGPIAGPSVAESGRAGSMARDVLSPMAFREYAIARQIESSNRIPLTLPNLLTAFHALSHPPSSSSSESQTSSFQPQTPSRTAYLLLLEAAANYSEQSVRRGEEGYALFSNPPSSSSSLSSSDSLFSSITSSSSSSWSKSPPANPFKPNSDPTKFFGLPLPSSSYNLGFKIALSAYEDARLGGYQLGIEGFDSLLRASSPYPSLLPHLISHLLSSPMKDLIPEWTRTTITSMLKSPMRRSDRRLERLVMLVIEAKKRGVRLNPKDVRMVVGVCCDWGLVRLGMELLEWEEGGITGDGGTAGGEVLVAGWMDVLRASADLYFLEGVEKGWQRAVLEQNAPVDEGLLISVLNVAGRYGLPSLSTSVITILTRNAIPIKEYHLAPLLESFCESGKLSDAMEVLDVMRTTAGIEPDLKTTEPIVRILKRGKDNLDKAFYALEGFRIQGKSVDVAALNAVLKGSSLLAGTPEGTTLSGSGKSEGEKTIWTEQDKIEVSRKAIAMYLQAPTLGIRPNTETFNILLEICVKLKAKQQGEALLKAMENPPRLPSDSADSPAPSPIQWNQETYENLVALSLTQPTYEDAFSYLEKMKSDKIRPPSIIYERLAVKCLSKQDERYRAVLEEMQLNNYKPSSRLLTFVRRYNEGEQVSYDRLEGNELVGGWGEAINRMVGYAGEGSGARGGYGNDEQKARKGYEGNKSGSGAFGVKRS